MNNACALCVYYTQLENGWGSINIRKDQIYLEWYQRDRKERNVVKRHLATNQKCDNKHFVFSVGRKRGNWEGSGCGVGTPEKRKLIMNWSKIFALKQFLVFPVRLSETPEMSIFVKHARRGKANVFCNGYGGCVTKRQMMHAQCTHTNGA